MRSRQARMPDHDPIVELHRLQTETMQQLERIAEDIKAGRVPAEEGGQRARALVAASDARRSASFAAGAAAADRRTRRAWLMALAVVVAAAVAVLGRVLLG